MSAESWSAIKWGSKTKVGNVWHILLDRKRLFATVRCGQLGMVSVVSLGRCQPLATIVRYNA